MIKLFTEKLCIKLDGITIYKNQILKNDDYLNGDICFKIGKKIAKLGLQSSSTFNVFDDIVLYVISIDSITSTKSSIYCIFNVAVCLK